jgi:hypothetical protein
VTEAIRDILGKCEESQDQVLYPAYSRETREVMLWRGQLAILWRAGLHHYRCGP